MRTNERRVCAGVMPCRPALGFFKATFQVLAHEFDDVRMLLQEVGNALQGGIEVDTLTLQLDIGETKLAVGKAAHFFFSVRSSSRLISQMRSKESLSLW
jgi:hypothetical protein